MTVWLHPKRKPSTNWSSHCRGPEGKIMATSVYHFLAFENRRHRYFSPLTVISNAPSWLSKLEAVPVSTLFSFSRFSLSNFKRASCFTISAWLEQQQVFDYIRRNPDAESQYLWASSHSEVFQIGYGEAKTRNYQHKLLESVRRYLMYPPYL